MINSNKLIAVLFSMLLILIMSFFILLDGSIFNGGYNKLLDMFPILVSLVSLVLFLKYNNEDKIDSKNNFVWMLVLIILNGTIIRLFLASVFFGNYDMRSCDIIADIMCRGGNVYAETNRYNYSPIWFICIGFLKQIQTYFEHIPLHFILRTFLCGIDLLSLFFLLLIAKLQKISSIKTALFFYLNPVSFLITGYHGQFENLAVLMVVIGIFVYLKINKNFIYGKIILWGFATLGMIIKHNIFYEVIICLNFAIKRFWVKLCLFTASSLFFLMSFIPYWNTASKGILHNVFFYSSNSGFYGISSLFNLPILKYLFIIGLFSYPFFIKTQDIVKQCLLGVLFFLVFTTGIGIQYFVLPIAFGALRPSKGFLFFSIITSLFILGSRENLHIAVFSCFSWNIVWIGVIYWFVTEMYKITINFELKKT